MGKITEFLYMIVLNYPEDPNSYDVQNYKEFIEATLQLTPNNLYYARYIEDHPLKYYLKNTQK